MSFFEGKRIVIPGGSGFLGSHLVDMMGEKGIAREAKISVPRSRESDLRDQKSAISITKDKDILINLAANVGGIGYNLDHPGRLFYDNIMIGANLLEAARINDIEKVVQIGTICSYPKYTSVPFREDDIWEGYPDETNAPYGIAKRALLVMADAYRQEYGLKTINLLAVNLYGPRDRFDPRNSHVIPALMMKFYQAKTRSSKSVTLWGTGKASREFLYVKDAAEAIILATEKYSGREPVNIGSNSEITIEKLAELIAGISGFSGTILWDSSMPDGQPRRLLNTERALKAFGFKAKMDLENGLRLAYDWYVTNAFREQPFEHNLIP
ncbi:MAG: GDP-L-fucose synthase [Candidatus Thermoplasmatota archaeon]|nr:GDP-L-fucose synthase [Candidatus Thermoplasmatota archaeon]